MEQPVPSYTDADLDRVITRDYPPEAIHEVRELLARYGQEAGQREVLRVRMACLKCADGDLEELARVVEDACCDYRDLLIAAEYPLYVRAKSLEARRQAIASDWKQLQEWLSRG